MPPQAISAGLALLEALIANEPAIADELKTLFSKTEVTPADWQALRARINNFSYSKYDPSFQDPTPGGLVTPVQVPITVLPAPVSASPVTPVPPPNTPPAATPVASSLSSATAPIGTASQADTPAPAALTATAAPESVPATAQLPALPFPVDAAGITAMVAAADPQQLSALYKAGGMVADAVNQRWHTGK